MHLGVVWLGPLIAVVPCYQLDGIKVILKEPKAQPLYRLFVLCMDENWTVGSQWYLPHQFDLLFYLSPSGREFKRHCKYVHDYSEQVIRDRRIVLVEQLKEGEALKITGCRHYLDFLDILLTSKDNDGSGLSDEETRAEVDTFMFEGHDTTAAGVTCMVICVFELHRQPDIWENPKVYDPLRFLPERSEGRDNFVYMPFSAGPRNCIGQNFALNEERVVIGRILDKFSLRLDDSHSTRSNPLS